MKDIVFRYWKILQYLKRILILPHYFPTFSIDIDIAVHFRYRYSLLFSGIGKNTDHRSTLYVHRRFEKVKYSGISLKINHAMKKNALELFMYKLSLAWMYFECTLNVLGVVYGFFLQASLWKNKSAKISLAWARSLPVSSFKDLWRNGRNTPNNYIFENT